MQLLNDSRFRVTAEANQRAFGTGAIYWALAFLPRYDFRVHIRDAVGIEMKHFGWCPYADVLYFSQNISSGRGIQKYSVINGITNKKITENKCAHICEQS
jgi:hypothetical protein